jgi:hypothetical protein
VTEAAPPAKPQAKLKSIETDMHALGATLDCRGRTDVALAFAYEPDAKVDASLARMRQSLIDKFLMLFPSAEPECMAAGVDCIIGEIQKRRREIEAAGATLRVNSGTLTNM